MLMVSRIFRSHGLFYPYLPLLIISFHWAYSLKGNFILHHSLRLIYLFTLQNGGAQGIENVSCGKVLPGGGHLKVPLSYNNGFPGFGSSTGAQVSADRVQPKFIYGRILNEPKVNPDASSEQNQAPKLDKSKTQLIVKAYTTRTGVADAQGNITIYLDQYNKNDFPVDYVNAKFFVIKSYSEDDVHKSIKYNVWSSTPNGNKKLNHAYEDARRLAVGDPVGCPVFLFFSVSYILWLCFWVVLVCYY